MGIVTSVRSFAVAAAVPVLLAWGGPGCATAHGDWANDVLLPMDVRQLPATDAAVAASTLLDEEIVRFDEVDGQLMARTFARSRTRIHGHAGQEFRGVSINYSSVFSAVEALEARVSLPDGSSRLVDGDDALDVPTLGSYMLYADSRNRSLKVPTIGPGGVVERVSIVKTTSPELFSFGFAFGASIPTDTARFVVDAPAGWVLDHVVTGPAATEPARTVVDGRQRLVWERQALAPLRWDRYSPRFADLVEFVSVRLRKAVLSSGVVVEGPGNDVELSRMTAGLMAGRDEVTPEITAIAGDVLGDAWRDVSKRDRAARLYAWTRDSIRYCAIEVGLGGWVPHASGEVERLRYGDCKDKANLLKALLSAVDVKSRIVTIHSSVAPTPFRLPVLAANFNHAILVVDLDDGPVFVDPTTRTVAFADLPPNDEDRICLPIDLAGAPLLTTPSSSPATDHRTARYQLTAERSGMVQGRVQATFAGHFADGLRDAILETPTADHAALYADQLATEGTVADAVLTDAAPPIHVTPVAMTATVKVALGGDNRRFGTLHRGVDYLEVGAPRLEEDRPAIPVTLWARDRIHDVVEVTLPAGFTVKQVPTSAAVDGPLVSWRVSWSAVAPTAAGGSASDGGGAVVVPAPRVISLERELIVHENRIPTERVGELRAALDGYFRAMEARVVLVDAGPTKKAPAPTTPTTTTTPSPTTTTP